MTSFGSAHFPTGTVGAGAKRIGITFTSHDVRLGPHTAGNNSHLAYAYTNRPFARHPTVDAEMMFTSDIVMVAIDHFTSDRKRGQMPVHACQYQSNMACRF